MPGGGGAAPEFGFPDHQRPGEPAGAVFADVDAELDRFLRLRVGGDQIQGGLRVGGEPGAVPRRPPGRVGDREADVAVRGGLQGGQQGGGHLRGCPGGAGEVGGEQPVRQPGLERRPRQGQAQRSGGASPAPHDAAPHHRPVPFGVDGGAAGGGRRPRIQGADLGVHHRHEPGEGSGGVQGAVEFHPGHRQHRQFGAGEQITERKSVFGHQRAGRSPRVVMPASALASALRR
jgi:hypothetical protein